MKKTNSLKVIPLGGLDEIGKNMTAIEYKDDIIIIDSGSSFPDENMHGVQVVIPDYSYLIQNKNKVKKLFITHGHEDHIGGIKYFLNIFPNVKVYASRLTKHLIEKKIRERPQFKKNLVIVNNESNIKTRHFDVSFFKTNHSIPDSLGIVIRSPYGNIVHTGDIKVDFTPIDNQTIDYNRLNKVSNEGVLLLLGDSTNSKKPGFSKSEKTVAQNIENVLKNIKNKRIIATTFASSLYRIQSIISIAEKQGRKVIPIGRSMEENISIAKETGYIKAKETTIISPEEMKKKDPNKLLILTTGSQGEPTSALKKMVEKRHNIVELTERDFVLFSSNAVPGNEKNVNDLKNELEKHRVEYVNTEELHTSGHGYKEELKMILSLLKPRYLMPVHGEFSMMKEHGRLGQLTGVKKENIFILNNGDILEYNGEKMFSERSVEIENKLVDESEEGTVNFNVMKDRKRMSTHGVVVAKVKDKHEGVFVKLICKGIVVSFDKEKLELEVKQRLEKVKMINGELDFLSITKSVQNVFKDKLNRSPLIILN